MLNVDALLAVLESVKENGIAELKISNDLVEIRTYVSSPQVAVTPVVVEQSAPVFTAESQNNEHVKKSVNGEEEKPKVAEAAAKPEVVQTSGRLEIIEAPIPGTVFVGPSKDLNGTPLPIVGQKVEKGQVIALLEAMKMFNEIFSPVAGVVRDIKINSETSVSPGDTIMTIELL